MSGAIPSLPNTPSWRGAQSKYRDNIITLVFVVTKSKGRLGFQNSIEPNKELGVHETGFRSPYVQRTSRSSSVSIVTTLQAGRPEFDTRRGQLCDFFPFATESRLTLRSTQPNIQWVPGALIPEVKRPGREADDSSPFSAEVKTVRSYISTPQYVCMAWCLVKQRTTLPTNADDVKYCNEKQRSSVRG
jgi:hypothetical protein